MQALADIVRSRCTAHQIIACSADCYRAFLGDAGLVYIRGPGRWRPHGDSAPLYTTLPLSAAALKLDSLGDELFLLLEDGGLYRVQYGQLTARLWRRGVRDFCWQFPCIWYIRHDNSVRSANPTSGRGGDSGIIAPEDLVSIAAPTSNMTYCRHHLFLLGRSGAVYWWRAEHEYTEHRRGEMVRRHVPAEVGRLATPGLRVTTLHWTRDDPGELILHDRLSDKCYYLPFDDLERPIVGKRRCDCARLPLPEMVTAGGNGVTRDSYEAYFQQLVAARMVR